MNIGAHPLVVAVALGLLGPHALAEETEEEGSVPTSTACEGCTCGAVDGLEMSSLDCDVAARDVLARSLEDMLTVDEHVSWEDGVKLTVED